MHVCSISHAAHAHALHGICMRCMGYALHLHAFACVRTACVCSACACTARVCTASACMCVHCMCMPCMHLHCMCVPACICTACMYMYCMYVYVLHVYVPGSSRAAAAYRGCNRRLLSRTRLCVAEVPTVSDTSRSTRVASPRKGMG